MGLTDLPLRTELTRAYTRLFGTRGGFSPSVGREIIPVQIMDTPAWPATRHFVASDGAAALAAVNSIIQIANTDPLDSQSLVVIDWMRLQNGVAQDIIFGLHPIGTVAYAAGPFTVPDMSPAPPGTPGGVTKLANVSQGNSQVAFTPAGFRIVNVATYETPANFPNITILPQFALVIAGGTVNTSFNGAVAGRYYSPL